MRFREATPLQHAEILSILDGAALQTDSEQVRRAIERGDVFVAIPERGGRGAADSSPVLGALVLDETKISAVAVRPGRRGQGIGRSLVARAKRNRKCLVAEFDPSVEPFWTAVGFDIIKKSADRLTGVYHEESGRSVEMGSE